MPGHHQLNRTRSNLVLGIAATVLLLGGISVIRSAAAGDPGRRPTEPGARSGADVGPIEPGDLPQAGLVAERTDAMRAALDEVQVAPPTRRDGPPAGAFDEPRADDPGDASEGGSEPGSEGGADGCDLRDQILPRDLTPVTFAPNDTGCRVSRGLLLDPYLDRSIAYSERSAAEVGIDRIVPLAYAWQHGAASWTAAQRRAFARDPANLLAADARPIAQKRGRGPSGWLPPNVGIRCAYAARFAAVLAEHGLTMDPADAEIARRQC